SLPEAPPDFLTSQTNLPPALWPRQTRVPLTPDNSNHSIFAVQFGVKRPYADTAPDWNLTRFQCRT
ncbi:MAG: hypothetical protein LBK62_10950, partial [Treponema sp.]|nr:hypothetical protein [Treponema sp.]